MSSIRHITIVGSGLAAQYFARLFHSHAFVIDSIICRNAAKGKLLAESVKANWSDDFTQICYSDLVLVCVKDDAIAEVVKDLTLDDGIIAHCAGAMPLTVLSQFERSAVVYPLQTLINNASNTTAPILLETAFKQDLGTLKHLMEQCGNPTYAVDSEKRKHYHLAAVFANNFGNALMHATLKISHDFELDFDLLKPLISHTLQNVLDGHLPEQLQTGPARRKDRKTMNSHKQLLKDQSELKKLYEAMSEYIGTQYKK
jgi:predicted short-subunit dehydrogenase-like oxidoreductase (DUF2520 family)